MIAASCVLLGGFVALTGWVMWSVTGWGNLVFADHIDPALLRRRRSRAFAAMGLWQIAVGVVLIIFAVQQHDGTAVSNSPALFMLGLGFLVAAWVTRRERPF